MSSGTMNRSLQVTRSYTLSTGPPPPRREFRNRVDTLVRHLARYYRDNIPDTVFQRYVEERKTEISNLEPWAIWPAVYWFNVAGVLSMWEHFQSPAKLETMNDFYFDLGLSSRTPAARSFLWDHMESKCYECWEIEVAANPEPQFRWAEVHQPVSSTVQSYDEARQSTEVESTAENTPSAAATAHPNPPRIERRECAGSDDDGDGS